MSNPERIIRMMLKIRDETEKEAETTITGVCNNDIFVATSWSIALANYQSLLPSSSGRTSPRNINTVLK